MKIIADFITFDALETMAAGLFGDMVKGVVDVERDLVALDAELHADLEASLLEQGSSQNDLWGINLYPGLTGENFLEFDAMINLRPSQGNRSRAVEDEGIRGRIVQIVSQRIRR